MYYQKAVEYAFRKLREELPEKLYYHGIHHTIDVCQVVDDLAFCEQVTGEDLILLSTAAVYHDIGFTVQYQNNEPVAASIARESLPEFAYTPRQIDIISHIILATRIPQKPTTLLEEIMCDADLDYLGREDFPEIAKTLQQEWMEFGLINSEEEWNCKQVSFFQQHQYFTRTAREKRELTKNKHLQKLQKMLSA
jgi:predicted metal-dependent HD superfamily phosphohydrolase